MLNKTNVSKMKRKGMTGEFNCWGATAHALGAIKKPYWVCGHDMNSFIRKFTKSKSGEFKEGDIVVIYNTDGGRLKKMAEYDLIHTAVYIGDGMWYHKLGSRG